MAHISGRATTTDQRSRPAVFLRRDNPTRFHFIELRSGFADEQNLQKACQAFFNTLTVVIPATIILILVAYGGSACCVDGILAVHCWSRRLLACWSLPPIPVADFLSTSAHGTLTSVMGTAIATVS
jgi:hypothetical protein